MGPRQFLFRTSYCTVAVHLKGMTTTKSRWADFDPTIDPSQNDGLSFVWTDIPETNILPGIMFREQNKENVEPIIFYDIS